MPEAGKTYLDNEPFKRLVVSLKGDERLGVEIGEGFGMAKGFAMCHHFDLQARLLPTMGRNDRRGAHSNSFAMLLSDRPLESNSLTFVFRLLRDVNSTGRTRSPHT